MPGHRVRLRDPPVRERVERGLRAQHVARIGGAEEEVERRGRAGHLEAWPTRYGGGGVSSQMGTHSSRHALSKKRSHERFGSFPFRIAPRMTGMARSTSVRARSTYEYRQPVPPPTCRPSPAGTSAASSASSIAALSSRSEEHTSELQSR